MKYILKSTKVFILMICLVFVVFSSSCKKKEITVEELIEKLDIYSEKNINLSPREYLDKVVRFDCLKRYNASDLQDLNLNYRDPLTKKQYTADRFASAFDGNTQNYYKNNVMHVDGYFDVELKVLISETKDEKGQIVTILEYIFFFYNIDYINMGFESTSDPQEKIKIAFVGGVNNKTEDEFDENEDYTGDYALELMMDDDSYAGDPAIMKYTYGYYDPSREIDFNYLIFDKGATVDGENLKIGDASNPVTVYKCNISVAPNTNSQYFDELESATFCIYLLEDGKASHTTLVEGTIENILSLEELNN